MPRSPKTPPSQPAQGIPSPINPLSVLDVARRLSSFGYYLVPVARGTKAAVDRNWVDLRLTPADIPLRFDVDSHPGVGLLTGVEVSIGVFVIGIDIDLDDPVLIERVGLAFSSVPPSKKGSKGCTYFCRVGAPLKKRYFKRKDPITGALINCVEVLATGQQTVIPPSLHPSGIQYTWSTTPLFDVHPEDLPALTPQIMQEIELAVKLPDSALFLLNTMESDSGKGGGTIHNSVLAATAVMVSYGWDDDVIWERVRRSLARLSNLGREYADDKFRPLVQNMIEDARKKGFAENGKKKKTKVHILAANWLIDEWIGKDRVYNRTGMISAYRGGWYDMVPHDDVRHTLSTKFAKPNDLIMDHRDFSAAVDTALDCAQRFPNVKPARRVCLLNGTFDMDEGVLGEWAHDDYLISQLDFHYDPDAACPVYEKFLSETFHSEDHPDDLQLQIDAFEEFVSHTLFECLDFHKMMIINGQPRTGKSTLTKLARMMHSPKAVSAVSVRDMGTERANTSMVGKLLNVVSEVGVLTEVPDEFLKSVTGGDLIDVRYLYGERFSTVLPTRIMIACNDMPRITDNSGAVQSRMIILTCDNQIPEQDRDTKLEEKLRAELPGIFNRMTRAWKRLDERRYFVPPAGSKVKIAAFTEENNHVLHWIKERTHQGMIMFDPDYVPPEKMPDNATGMLYLDFTEWAKINGFKQMSSISFGMRLSQLKIPVKATRVGGRVLQTRALSLLNGASF